MEDPFNPLKSVETFVTNRLDAIKSDVERAVKIALLREVAGTTLSRLATLDTDRAVQYTAALEAMH